MSRVEHLRMFSVWITQGDLLQPMNVRPLVPLCITLSINELTDTVHGASFSLRRIKTSKGSNQMALIVR